MRKCWLIIYTKCMKRLSIEKPKGTVPGAKGREEKKKKEEEEKDEVQKEVAMLETEVDEFTRSLYEDVITLNHQDTGNKVSSLSKDKKYYHAKWQTLYDTIKVQVITYIKFCKDMNMLLVLEQNGNEVFKNDVECNHVNRSKIIKGTDAVYVAKYFDLLLRWKQEGSRSFAEVSCAALVMLGKPNHNAFQERVLVEALTRIVF
jgi:hypothetical protein